VSEAKLGRHDVLHLKVGPEKWTLRAGPGFFVGRVEPGRDVVVLRDPRRFEKAGEPLPKKVDLGSGQSVVPRAVKNKTSNCEVALVIPVIAGVKNATDLNRGFAVRLTWPWVRQQVTLFPFPKSCTVRKPRGPRVILITWAPLTKLPILAGVGSMCG